MLAGTRFERLRWVAVTGSTNEDVLEAARSGEAEGLVVTADAQTAGRGRRGRTWETPVGGALMVTVLLRPPAATAGLVTAALGLAAAEAVEACSGVAPRLKWPNDLVWPGDGSGPDRKLAGILAEADWPAASNISGGWREPRPGDRVAVAAGIGLNLTWGGGAPPPLADVAVALEEITDRPVPDRVDLLVSLLRRLDEIETDLRADGGTARLLDAWRGRSATLGRRVRVDLGADDVVGTAIDIDESGHLVVETLEGERRSFAVGDVVHLRGR